MTKTLKTSLLILVTTLISCNNTKTDQNKTKMIDEIFKKKVVVILSEDLDPKSNVINVQDYTQEGKSFIPVFTSVDKFNESTKGAVKNQKIAIDGMFFLSLLKGNEEIRINPTLNDEIIISSAELIKRNESSIKETMLKMQQLKDK